MVRSDDPTVYSGIMSCRGDTSSVYTETTSASDKYSNEGGLQSHFRSKPSSPQSRDMPPASPGNDSSIGGILRTSSYGAPRRSHECDFDKSPTKLYLSIQEKNWENAVKHCRNNPIEAATWISRREKDGRLRWRLLPLHAAVIFKAPERVIESLLCAYPHGAQEKDDQGMLPLHLAFRNGSSEGVVQLLLVAYPKSIEVKDRKGRVPLVLAQASASPNRDAFVRALQRGPAYYAVAAAATERTGGITAEQQAAFESKIADMQHKHAEEIADLKRNGMREAAAAAAASATDLEMKAQSLQDELDKARDTSQVLVDHVTTLEKQIKSKDEMEQILTEQIHDLKAEVGELNGQVESNETFIVQERDAALTENLQLKASLRKVEGELEEAKQDILNQSVQSARALSSRDDDKRRLESNAKKAQSELATAKANVTVLESQLKKKVVTEQSLAAQVSDLATRLVEANESATESEAVHVKRIETLEAERDELTETVDNLTKRLSNVAAALAEMATEQDKILEEVAVHETTMAKGMEKQQKLVEDAAEQGQKIEAAKREREEIVSILAQHADEIDLYFDERKRIMEAVTTQDKEMRAAAAAREELIARVRCQKESMRALRDFQVQPVIESGNELIQQARSSDQDYEKEMHQLKQERQEAVANTIDTNTLLKPYVSESTPPTASVSPRQADATTPTSPRQERVKEAETDTGTSPLIKKYLNPVSAAAPTSQSHESSSVTPSRVNTSPAAPVSRSKVEMDAENDDEDDAAPEDTHLSLGQQASDEQQQHPTPVESLTTEELIEEGSMALREMPSLAGRYSPTDSQEGSEQESETSRDEIDALSRSTPIVGSSSDGEEETMEREAKELEEQLTKLQLQSEHIVYSVVALESHSMLSEDN